MNKNFLIAIVVIVLALGGYYQFSMKPAQEAAQAAAAAAAEAAAAEAAAVEQAAADAAAAAEKAAAEAALAVETAAAEAAAALEAAKNEAMALLDPAAFDAQKITAMIDASALDDATKATLKAAVAAAATSPALVQGALDAVKSALGM